MKTLAVSVGWLGAATLVLAGAVVSPGEVVAAPVIEEFGCTGAPAQWTVPEGVTEATFDLYGAQGAPDNTGNGGAGGRVTATVAVTSGETLQVVVGCQGERDGGTGEGAGGFNGGGNGGSATVGGGGGR